ncbi:MAG: hypothetical protein KGJ52_09220, partial [Gammaproteobacteria bacterium]|nr:hypothetical protein [Gammaproteobacteria bacterium]
MALLSQRSRWLLAAARNPLLRPLLRLPMPLLLPLPRLPPRLLMLLPRPPLLRLLRPLLRLPLRLLPRLRRRTDPIGSGMKARAGRDPVCTG